MPTPSKGESKQDFLKRCMSVVTEDTDADGTQAYSMCNAFWDETHNTRSMMKLSAPVAFEAAKDEGKKRQFAITGYTGQVMDTWFGKVVFNVGGMSSKEKIPVLREHQRDRVVGFGAAWNDGKNFYVKGDFSGKTVDAREVLDLADEGYPWQASVGIWPRKVKVLDNSKVTAIVNGREIAGPAEIWEESDVGEVSFVSLGRDDNTAAISLSETGEMVAVDIEHVSGTTTATAEDAAAPPSKETIMDIKEFKEKHAELYRQVFEDGREDGIKAERGRVIEIMGAGGDEIEAKKLIEDGTPATECYKRFFIAEKEKRQLGLESMKNQAPASQGIEPPAEPTVDSRSADVILADRARKVMAERKVSYEAACRQCLADDPDLKAKYRALYSV